MKITASTRYIELKENTIFVMGSVLFKIGISGFGFSNKGSKSHREPSDIPHANIFPARDNIFIHVVFYIKQIY